MTDNNELDLFREMTVRCLEQEVSPHYETWEEQAYTPREIWNTLGEAGLLGPDLPEEYGAAAADFEVTQMVTEEMSRMGFGGLGSGYNIHSNIVMPYILHIGTEQQKQQWLPKMVSGEVLGAIAMTEPGAGSDLAAMKTSAVRDGEDWLINGSKVFITNGIYAELVIVCAKTDPSKGAKGISLFLVDSSLPGFSCGQSIKKIGQHSSDTAELFFEDLRVPANALLGEAGMGFVYLMQELPRERLGVAAQAIGAMDGAMTMAIDYTKERKAFGSTISQFQNTRFKMAECKTKLEFCRALFEKFMVKYKAGKMTVEDAAVLKLGASEAQIEVVDQCLQMFGGYGYTMEYPISRFYVDARIQTIYAGSSEIMKEVISRDLFK